MLHPRTQDEERQKSHLVAHLCYGNSQYTVGLKINTQKLNYCILNSHKTFLHVTYKLLITERDWQPAETISFTFMFEYYSVINSTTIQSLIKENNTNQSSKFSHNNLSRMKEEQSVAE